MLAAQNSLSQMESKFIVLSEHMSKVQPAIAMMEQELHKKDIIIENYEKDMVILKA